MTAGQDFAKKLGLFGCVLLLIIYILYLVVCFTAKPKDAAPQESPVPAASTEAAYEITPEGTLSI